MSNHSVKGICAKSELKLELAEFSLKSSYQGMVYNMTSDLLEKYNYDSITLKSYARDASQFALKELFKEIEAGEFVMDITIKNRGAYMTGCLKKRIYSFLNERLERSSKRKTKAQIRNEQEIAGENAEISKFEPGYRFSSINTEQGQESIKDYAVELTEYDGFDAESYMLKQGLSERSAAMMKMRLQGYNYTEIGQHFDLRESRARELIKESAEILGADIKMLK